MKVKYEIGDKVYFVPDLDLAEDTEIRWGKISEIEIDVDEILYIIYVGEERYSTSETFVLGKTRKDAIKQINELTDNLRHNWIKELD